MKGLLLVTMLCTSSSYARNVEVDAEGHAADTVQWWFGEDETWRIRTFGLDHDIHSFLVHGISAEDAKASTRRNFSDITCHEVEVTIEDARDAKATAAALKSAALPPHFEVLQRLMFWKPDNAEYRTQTAPR